MKNTRKAIFCAMLGMTVLTFSACGKTAPAASSSAEDSSLTITESQEPEENISVNEDVTTVSTYYEEPAPASATGDAEGFVPQDMPEGTIQDAKIKDECIFTEGGNSSHAVLVEKAELTDRRSVIPNDSAPSVLLITYSYRSLNGEPALVDDMSFRLFTDKKSCEPYYVADQLMGDVAGEESVTAEICFVLPEGSTSATLFVVDNTAKDNENYRIELTF